MAPEIKTSIDEALLQARHLVTKLEAASQSTEIADTLGLLSECITAGTACATAIGDAGTACAAAGVAELDTIKAELLRGALQQ